MLPSAYENGGNSDGVTYRILLENEGEAATEFTSWHVNPRDTPEDRGRQERTIELPPEREGQVLRFVTEEGPRGDRGWDQAYLTEVRFAPPAKEP